MERAHMLSRVGRSHCIGRTGSRRNIREKKKMWPMRNWSDGIESLRTMLRVWSSSFYENQ